MRVYLCEDSIEGIFSALYVAWNQRNGHKNNYIRIKKDELGYNLELFTEYVEVKNSECHVEQVALAIKQKISMEAYEWVCKCACSEKEEKGDYIYRFLILGFEYGKDVMKYIHHPYVLPVFQINREIGREIEHYYGFLRFTQLENSILYAKAAPKNNIIALIAPHFSDRLPNENWIIYDEKRQKAVLHEKQKGYFLIKAKEDAFKQLENNMKSNQEEQIEQLWKGFVSAISIKERKNIKIQQNMLPKKFRNYMVEFQENSKSSQKL